MMKKLFLSLSLLTLCNAWPLLASADESQDVYLCIDERGHKEYKNTGVTKNCKKVDLPAITTVAAPVRKPASSGTSSSGSKPASSPSDFPKVDSGTQKKRDSDSKQIFEDELRAEEQKLANYKKEFNGGQPERRGDESNFAKYQDRVQQMRDDIARTEKNIEALKREMANVKN
jgi:hypothetical protein